MEAQVRTRDIPRQRPNQFELWSEADGQIFEPMPSGDYLKVNRSGAIVTANEHLSDIWIALQREAQQISANGFTLTPMVGKDLVGNTIDAINRSFALVTSRVVTHANRLFSSTFGGPISYTYDQMPIRWTGENREALKYVLKFVEALYQIPQVRSNTLDSGIPSEHASLIMRPLFLLKQDIMKHLFGIEVQGAVSPQELDAMFRNSNLQPPIGSSFDDNRDSRATLTDEDTTALGNESAQVPTVETSEQVREGLDVWTWVPTNSNWDTFAELTRRMEFDGPNQPVAAPFPFSTEQVGGGNSSAGGGSGALMTPTN